MDTKLVLCRFSGVAIGGLLGARASKIWLSFNWILILAVCTNIFKIVDLAPYLVSMIVNAHDNNTNDDDEDNIESLLFSMPKLNNPIVTCRQI